MVCSLSSCASSEKFCTTTPEQRWRRPRPRPPPRYYGFGATRVPPGKRKTKKRNRKTRWTADARDRAEPVLRCRIFPVVEAAAARTFQFNPVFGARPTRRSCVSERIIIVRCFFCFLLPLSVRMSCGFWAVFIRCRPWTRFRQNRCCRVCCCRCSWWRTRPDRGRGRRCAAKPSAEVRVRMGHETAERKCAHRVISRKNRFLKRFRNG